MYARIFKFNPHHDAQGRFATGGISNSDFSPLDRKILNYNPKKPLDASGGDDLQRIEDLIPGAQYVPYTKTPFFDQLTALQGVHPKDVEGYPHAKARKELFVKQPVEDLPSKDLIFTQNVVNIKGIARAGGNPDPSPAQVVRYQGKNYLMDGHHRVVDGIAHGESTVHAHVLTIEPEAKKYAQILKFNPYHDDNGRFTVQEGGVLPGHKNIPTINAMRMAMDKVGEAEFERRVRDHVTTLGRQLTADEYSHEVERIARQLIAQKLEFARILKFNENHDERGRFASGPSSGEDLPKSVALSVSGEPVVRDPGWKNQAIYAERMIRETASKLRFKGDVQVIYGEAPSFKVGDATYREGGHWDAQNNRIVIRGDWTLDKTTQNFGGAAIAGVTAHEVQHSRWTYAKGEYELASALISKEPRGEAAYKDPVMRASGELKPPYDAKYPAYVQWNAVFNDGKIQDQLEKEDGVTDYSRAYWKNKDAPLWRERAIDETLAEIANLKAQNKYYKAAPSWEKAYKAVNRIARDFASGANRRAYQAGDPNRVVKAEQNLWGFDARFKLCPVDQAVVLKYFEPDGSHTWLTPIPDKQKPEYADILKWDENQPRDDRGRWTSGGGDLGPTRAERIKELAQGLTPGDYSSLPPKAVQPTANKDELYKRAAEGLEQLRDWLNRGTGVACKMGYTLVKKSPDDMTAEDWRQSSKLLFIAPLKGMGRAEEKVNADYHGDWSQLKDVVRCTLATDNVNQLQDTIRTLEKQGMVLAQRPKNNMENASKYCYRDVNLVVKLPNGLLAEVQFNVKDMLQAKNEAHRYYEITRSIEAKHTVDGVQSDARTWPEKDQEDHADAAAVQTHVYQDAWSAHVRQYYKKKP